MLYKGNNMKKNLLASLILGCGFLSSCATNSDKISAHVANIGDVDDIEVKDLRSAKVNDNLSIQASVYNSSRSIQQIYYRCKFFDTNKFQVNNDVQWVPVQVYGKSSQDISCLATSPTAIDFKLEISSTGAALKVYK